MNIEKAAQKLADCMDYPWEFMSEQGRENMRNHVKAIIEAANSAPAEDVRAVVDEPVAFYDKSEDQLHLIAFVKLEDQQYVYRHPQRRLEMADVVKAHMAIPHCPVLTSNQCHALATKLNACIDEFARLNPEIGK